MIDLTLNGIPRRAPEGTTILSLCQSSGIEIPTLCHDDRLSPAGVCRLCLVSIKDWPRLAPACHTLITPGMAIETETDEVRENRRSVLELLAQSYPEEATKRFPEKPFHQLLAHYGVRASSSGSASCQSAGSLRSFQDATHPYLHADLSQCIDCFRCVRICHELQGQDVWHVVHRGAETRVQPGMAATLLESRCVSCGACVDTCPTGALEDQTVLRDGPADHWTRTVCPYCGTGCEMEVGTRGNRIVQIKPRLAAPVNRGHLCVKGRYAFEFTQAEDRVTQPMIREQGHWKTVSWQEAIQFTAEKLSALIRAHGPDSFGMLGSARGTNEENYLAQKFARVVVGTHNVDCCARVCHAPTAAAMKEVLGTGAATNSFDDIEQAKGFLLCGTNPTENHPIVGTRIRQAVRHGATLVVIDPRETELAQEADVHLALRPGSNIPLLNAIAHVIVNEQLVDRGTIRDRISGWPDFERFIQSFSPETVSEVCGVAPEKIREAARYYANSKPAMCFHGLGATEQSQGTEAVKCLVNLALLTGNFGKRGSGVNPLRGQNNVQGSAHMGCEPHSLTGFVGLEEGRKLFESIWQTSLSRSSGQNLMQMLESARAGSLKALWAIGYDVALSHPDSTATSQALDELELVVVQDLFLNELAKAHGTVFFPAASSFERDGTFMNSERRVQRIRRAIPPPGEALPDWQILSEVAKAMDHPQGFEFQSAEEIWEEVRTVWPAGRGITYDRLEVEGLQWPCPDENHPGTQFLHQDGFPTGPRAQLQCVDYCPTVEKISNEYPFLLTTGRTLHQFNAGTMTQRTPNRLLRPTDTLDISPEDARRLDLHTGEVVRLISRHGATQLPTRITEALKPGQLFATFHTREAFLNRVTSPQADAVTQTPEYKVVAVRVEKFAPSHPQ